MFPDISLGFLSALYCSDKGRVYFKQRLIIIFYNLIKTFGQSGLRFHLFFNAFPFSLYSLQILNLEKTLAHKASALVTVILRLFHHYCMRLVLSI